MTLTRLGRPQPVQNLGIMYEGFDKIVFLAFDPTVRGHVNIIDFLQRGFRSLAGLKQF